MEYKPRRANLVVDALSRKGELADISRPQSNLWDHITERLQHDSFTQTAIAAEPNKIAITSQEVIGTR